MTITNITAIIIMPIGVKSHNDTIDPTSVILFLFKVCFIYNNPIKNQKQYNKKRPQQKSGRFFVYKNYF